MIELISIHIPKTAGRSLLKALTDAYGVEQVLVVNRKAFREKRSDALDELRKRITPQTRVIHGHIHLSDISELLNEYPSARLITFLRDPVDRVISHYFHEKRILEETGHLSAFKEVPVDTLANYAGDEQSRNVMSRFLGGMPLSRFFFIGCFENFAADLQRLMQMLGKPLKEIPNENINRSQSPLRYNITPADREMIVSLNEDDVSLYQRSKKWSPEKKHAIRCWIASFPRSGNTFFRNILYYVYGIESGTWHREAAFPVDDDYDTFPFVKTHLLPHEVVPDDPSIKAICLVRDGRDCMVSIAHQRRDLVAPGSDLIENMREAIVAAEGSFFGGWSENINAWVQRADLIIRFEDLVADPKKQFERVEKLMGLPPGNWDQLPSFDELKKGKARYGAASRRRDDSIDPVQFAGKFFRKGKTGDWKAEMPAELHDLFWNYHGEMMEALGYEPHTSTLPQNPVYDYRIMKLMNRPVPQAEKSLHVLIEATKLIGTDHDGVKRYLLELIRGFEEFMLFGNGRYHFELLSGRNILPLHRYTQLLQPTQDHLHPYEKVLMNFKSGIQQIIPITLYRYGARIYRHSGIRKYLLKLRDQKSLEKEFQQYRELKKRIEETDLIHIPLPQNTGYLKHFTGRFLVTVHDLTHRITPDFHEEHNIRYTEEGMRFIAASNASVIAVSQSTAGDLIKHNPIPENKIHVVYETADTGLFRRNANPDLALNIREKYNLGNTPFLLTLSTIEPRKNLPNTIRAFKMLIRENPDLKVNLVVAGKFGWKTEHLNEDLREPHPCILFPGFINDQDLNVIYSEATALCYLSHHEGFGLPPLEAMRCRTPVIYGNNSSLVEIIADSGLAAGSTDISQIKDQMYRLVTDIALRESLAMKAHHRSFQFSKRRMIFETLNIYEKTLQ